MGDFGGALEGWRRAGSSADAALGAVPESTETAPAVRLRRLLALSRRAVWVLVGAVAVLTLAGFVP
ncbi:hypothetical protein, partial [Burkholderia sp. SIMBA_024]|uniref:hypothetical protein n=1 Tax=Burkholderia sp. SIMBA_024 TaxID=3085768 RepID=UPI00397E4B2E